MIEKLHTRTRVACSELPASRRAHVGSQCAHGSSGNENEANRKNVHCATTTLYVSETIQPPASASWRIETNLMSNYPISFSVLPKLSSFPLDNFVIINRLLVLVFPVCHASSSSSHVQNMGQTSSLTLQYSQTLKIRSPSTAVRPTPLKRGATRNTAVGPSDENCPKTLSRKKSGTPIRTTIST